MYEATDANSLQCSKLSVETLNHVLSQWPQIIEDILDRGGLPVVVGGTNFYIQVHRCRFPFLEFYHSSTLVDFLVLSIYVSVILGGLLQCLRLLLAHSCLRIWQKIWRVVL
jgi:hypothetical protein